MYRTDRKESHVCSQVSPDHHFPIEEFCRTAQNYVRGGNLHKMVSIGYYVSSSIAWRKQIMSCRHCVTESCNVVKNCWHHTLMSSFLLTYYTSTVDAVATKLTLSPRSELCANMQHFATITSKLFLMNWNLNKKIKVFISNKHNVTTRGADNHSPTRQMRVIFSIGE
jgi:hypothetical protein